MTLSYSGRKRGGAGVSGSGSSAVLHVEQLPAALVAEGPQLVAGAARPPRAARSSPTRCACRPRSPGRRPPGSAAPACRPTASGSSGRPSHSSTAPRSPARSRPRARAAAPAPAPQWNVTACASAAGSASGQRGAAGLASSAARPRPLREQLPPGGGDLLDAGRRQPLGARAANVRASTGSVSGCSARQSRAVTRWIVARISCPRTASPLGDQRRTARPAGTHPAATTGRRTGPAGSCACIPTSRSTTSSAGRSTRSSSHCRASSARFSSRCSSVALSAAGRACACATGACGRSRPAARRGPAPQRARRPAPAAAPAARGTAAGPASTGWS